MRRVSTIWLALVLLAAATAARAFDLQELQAQLSEPAVIRGEFTQEKHLRALPQPLVSQGRFVLARDQGLLWLLRQPIQQDYRITDAGVARRNADGWHMTDQQRAAAQHNRLFLAVLRGDSSALARDFDLQLSGTAERWQLALTPRAALLRQIFTQILISGGATPDRIELYEAQGDSTLLTLKNSQVDDQLSADEHHDLTH